MSISVVIMVGEAQEWIPELVEKSKKLTIGGPFEDVDIAPINGKENIARITGIIDRAEQDPDLKILLDGRNPKVPNFPNGNFVGPTIIDGNKPGQESYDEEIFGPVMNIVRVDNFTQALELVNSNQYGNGCSIF